MDKQVDGTTINRSGKHGKNYFTGTTYVSPKDRDGFIAELKRRCRNIDPTVR
jgi:hypothetical protein